MDRAAITELYDYTEFAWERIAATSDMLPPDQFGQRVDARPAQFEAPADGSRVGDRPDDDGRDVVDVDRLEAG